MRYKKFGSMYVVSIERGEELVSSLMSVCEKENITLGSVSGIGAAEDVEMGYYDVETQEYSSKTFSGSHEITALIGNVTTMDGKIYLHLHITIGDKEFRAYAGHLAKATVSGVCEICIYTASGSVNRAKDESIGLNTLSL